MTFDVSPEYGPQHEFKYYDRFKRLGISPSAHPNFLMILVIGMESGRVVFNSMMQIAIKKVVCYHSVERFQDRLGLNMIINGVTVLTL